MGPGNTADELNSMLNFGDDDNEEVDESEQRNLQEDLADIFMDIGPVTRELAPLKYKRKGHQLKSKTLLKVKGLPSVGSHEIDLDRYLFNHHYFHHLVGLSSLKKVLQPIAEDLNLHDLSPGEEDDTFAKETSYDLGQLKQSQKGGTTS